LLNLNPALSLETDEARQFKCRAYTDHSKY